MEKMGIEEATALMAEAALMTPTIGTKCPENKRCAERRGKCYSKDETVPEGMRKQGWCDKETKCRCYIPVVG